MKIKAGYIILFVGLGIAGYLIYQYLKKPKPPPPPQKIGAKVVRIKVT